MIRRALITFATGEHEQLLEVALPGFEAFADRHGYDLLIPEFDHLSREPSWLKLPAMVHALQEYGEVLWLDCDVVIVDGSEDPAVLIEPGKWQALVRHHTPDGEVPNCGVWLARRPMIPVLQAMWSAAHYLTHHWWEQAAMLDLLGYQHETRPCCLVVPTELYERTHWLGLEWNSHEQNDRHDSPRFAHVTPNDVEWRLPRMRAYASAAEANMPPEVFEFARTATSITEEVFDR